MKRVLLAFLLLGSAIGRADLTQLQMSEAVYDALVSFASSGNPVFTTPITMTWEDLSSFLTVDMDINPTSAFASEWDPIMQNLDDYLSSTSSNTVFRTQLLALLRSVAASSASNTLELVKQSLILEENFDVPLSWLYNSLDTLVDWTYTVDGKLQSGLNYLDTISSALDDVIQNQDDSKDKLSALTNLVDQMKITFDDLSLDMNNGFADLQISLGDIVNLFNDHFEGFNIGDLYAILQEFYANLPDIISESVDGAFNIPSNMNVRVTNWPEEYAVRVLNWPDWGDSLGNIATNTADIVDTLADWYPAATNFYAGGLDFFSNATARATDIASATAITNDVSTNLVSEVEHYDEEVEDSEDELRQWDPQDEIYSSSESSVSNPYDGGETKINTLVSRATGALEAPDTTFTPEVVLLGSNNRLPRITFSLDEEFSRAGVLSTLRTWLRLVWQFVGSLIRLGLVLSWLKWYSEMDKK